MQVIESKRTKVTIELTKSGEIKATAISKDIDEKVTVQEKTITTSKSAVTVVEKKESWFKRTLRQAKGVVKTILISAFIVSLIYLFFRFKSKITGFLKL